MRRPLLLSALLLLCAAAAAAGEDKPRISVTRFPFGSRIPNGVWSPMFTRIENPTARPMEVGVLTSFDMGGTGLQVDFLRRVTLPPRSERVAEIFVLMDYPAGLLRPQFTEQQQAPQTFDDGTKLEVVAWTAPTMPFSSRLVAPESGEKYDQQEFSALPVHPDAQFGLVIDGLKASLHTGERYLSRGLPYVLGEHRQDAAFMEPEGSEMPWSDAFVKRNEPLPADIGGVGLQTSSAMVEDLPTKWAAFEGVDVLILGSLRGGSGQHGLTPDQEHSLLRYVRAGGRLLVLPGTDLEAYRTPFWRQLLPVRLLGLRRLSGELAPAEKLLGKPASFDRDLPPLLVEALPVEGETLVRHGALPLLSRRAVGSGDVWFCAFNGAAAENWSAGHAFWAKAARARPNPAPGLRSHVPNNALPLLNNIIGVPAPDRRLVVLLLCAFLGLSAAALLVARRMRRQEYGWAAMMGLAVLGAFFSFAAGNLQRGKVGFILGEIGVTPLGPSLPQGGTTSWLGLYAPSDRRGPATWRSPDTLAASFPAFDPYKMDPTRAPETHITVEQGLRFSFPDLPLKAGELGLARAMTMSRFGDGVDLQVEWGAKAGPQKHAVRGRATNRTGKPLKDCLVRLNRRTLRIGALAPGETKDLSACPLSWELSASDFAGSDEDRVRRQLLAETLRQPETGFGMERIWAWPVAFYGWSEEPQAVLDLEGAQPRARALQLLVIPVAPTRPRGEVHLPAGACDLRLLRSGLRNAYGDPQRPLNLDALRLPQATHLAGATPAPVRRPAADMGADPYGAFASGPAPDPNERWRPTGWRSDTLPGSILVSFTPPAELAGLRPTSVRLILDADIRGFTPRLGVRKPGAEDFEPLRTAEIGRGRIAVEVPDLAARLGPAGELPEFELRFNLPPGGDPTASGRWTIREFDVEVTGRLPETEDP